MPQASDELKALAVIKENFTDDHGVIKYKDRTYKMTEREGDAIDYLCVEWDYAFEGANG